MTEKELRGEIDTMRILTPEEVSELWHQREHSEENDGSWKYQLDTMMMIAQDQARETLKELGEWLDKNRKNPPETAYGQWNIIVELPQIIAALLRGEMPE